MNWERYRGAAPRSFFGLVSFLERVAGDASPVGGDGPPDREAIRFRNDPDLGFHAADVRSVNLVDDPQRFEVVTTFLGLSGTISPLPTYISEGVLLDTFEKGTQRDFLDVFHHRAISILYRAVVRLQPAREHRSDASDPWLLRLLGLAGVHGDPTLALQARHLMVLIPILSKRSRGSDALRVAVGAVLRDELPGLRVRIRELVGRWLDVDADQHMRLGQANHRLGELTVLGRRVYDRRGRFAIRIGVLNRDQAQMFAEGQLLLDRLRATVSLILRDPLEYDLEIELDKDAVQHMRVGFSRLGTARLAGFRGNEVLTMRNIGRNLGVNRSLV
ncbi:MAG: type VI secretion system baseplate subunit TssG [Myxococcota bacterium]